MKPLYVLNGPNLGPVGPKISGTGAGASGRGPISALTDIFEPSARANRSTHG
jgi:hypothetical protein